MVTWFLLRDYSLSVRTSLIATNTIAQGRTREAGLAQILASGGIINYALKTCRWPGQATLEVSLFSLSKSHVGILLLNGRNVDFISSFLTEEDELGDPFPLSEHIGMSFQGTIVLGTGFILGRIEADKLKSEDRHAIDVIQPYINGDDLNSRSDHSPSRYVINFRDWDFERASKYKSCMQVLTDRVKPYRDELVANGKQIHEVDYWKFWDKRLESYGKLSGKERVLLSSRVTKYLGHVFVPSGYVYDVATNVVLYTEWHHFAQLQSTIHDVWAWKYGSTLESRLRYTNGNCIDTYPLVNTPKGSDASLAGQDYYDRREQLLALLSCGLTKLYNAFHHPSISIEGIAKQYKCDDFHASDALVKLQELRMSLVCLDSAILTMYGWSDITLAHNFYEVDYLPENDRIRYTISPAARRKVLERLLELNHRIHAEEVSAGLVDEAGRPLKGNETTGQDISKNTKSASATSQDSTRVSLFGPEEDISAVLFVEGNTDELYIRTVAKVCQREDLLEGIKIEPCGGAKQAREQAVAYKETHGHKCKIRVLFDWDDSGRVEYDKLKSDSLWGKNRVWTYRNWKPVEPSNAPVEAEDLFENGLLEAFIESCGEGVVTEKQKYKDGTFHYGIEQNQKKSLEYWVTHNLKPEHCGRWIKLLEDLRKSVGLG